MSGHETSLDAMACGLFSCLKISDKSLQMQPLFANACGAACKYALNETFSQRAENHLFMKFLLKLWCRSHVYVLPLGIDGMTIRA